MRRLIGQWRQISPNYYGDFYPLTNWTRDDQAWMAWQFNRPETGEGFVQVFRRHNSCYESARFKLRELDANAHYLVTSLDPAGTPRELAGRELTESGLPVSLNEQPSSLVLTYRKVR